MIAICALPVSGLTVLAQVPLLHTCNYGQEIINYHLITSLITVLIARNYTLMVASVAHECEVHTQARIAFTPHNINYALIMA